MVGQQRKIRMIALDLDNTTLRTDKSLAPRTKAALEESIRQGVKVVVSTGRAFLSLPKDILAIDGLEYVINSNGACITRLHDGEIIMTSYLGGDRVDAVAAILKEYDYPVETFSDGKAFTDQKVYNDLKENGSSFRTTAYVLWSRTPVPDIWDHLEATKSRIENISVTIPDPAEKEAVRKRLSAIDGLTITSSVTFNIEIEGPNTSKATALQFLLDRAGISREALMACGDSPNDIEMIRLAGLGVAVGNAEPEVRAAADYVTDTNDRDGVAKAIERFVLKRY